MDMNETVNLTSVRKENQVKNILFSVFEALNEKGYNPVNQIVGYIFPVTLHITSHKNARSMIRKLERDELLEELVKTTLK